jgi:integrase
LAPVWHESGLVFTSRLGTPVDPRNFHRAFVDRAKRAGVPVPSVHLTRKACASLLVALDVHPRVAMQILRHSKIAVTMEVYAEVVSSSTKEALRRLGEQLGRTTRCDRCCTLLLHGPLRLSYRSGQVAADQGWSQRDSNP